MKTLKDYLLDEMSIKMPEGTIPSEWFRKHNLPIVAECVCCKSTIALPTALIDNDGYIYCRLCGMVEEGDCNEDC